MKQSYQPHPADPPIVSSGLGALDHLLGGILWGDNVVWEVAAGASTTGVESALLHGLEHTGTRAAYVVFNSAPEAVRAELGIPGLEVLDCREGGSADEVAARIVALGVERGPGAVLVLENLGALIDRLGPEAAEEVFVRTCPNLLRTGGVAYWSLHQSSGRKLRREVRGITQCFIALEPDRIRVVKAEGRPVHVQGAVLRYANGSGPPQLEPAPALRLGPALRAIREQRGLNQTALARLAGISPSAISQAEQGRRGLSLETLVLLGERLGMTIDDILQGDAAPAYRLGRRSPGADASGTPALLLDDPSAGLRTSTVRLAPAESGLPHLETRGHVLLAVATGLVQVQTTGGAPVLRDGEVLSAQARDLTGYRNLGDDEAVLFFVHRP